MLGIDSLLLGPGPPATPWFLLGPPIAMGLWLWAQMAEEREGSSAVLSGLGNVVGKAN